MFYGTKDSAILRDLIILRIHQIVRVKAHVKSSDIDLSKGVFERGGAEVRRGWAEVGVHSQLVS